MSYPYGIPTSPIHMSSPKYTEYGQQFCYRTDSSTTLDDDRHDFYPAEKFYVAEPSPHPRKSRNRTTSFSTPRMAEYYSTAYPSSPFYADNPNLASPPKYRTMYKSSPQRQDPVSSIFEPHVKSKGRRFSLFGNGKSRSYYGATGSPPPKRRASARSQTHPIYGNILGDDDDDDAARADYGPQPTPIYVYSAPRQEYHLRQHSDAYIKVSKARKADPPPSSFQMPASYEYDSPRQTESPRSTRTRRPSYSQRQSSGTHHRRSSSGATKPSTPKKVHAQATTADCERCNIPQGYSTKNWDPTEKPILLVGSVFDANSLGKWIYDWTVLHYKAGTPMSEVAAEFWLLLIRLAARIKRADYGVKRLRDPYERDMVEEFRTSGKRLWQALVDLIGNCEDFMWETVKRKSRNGTTTEQRLKANAGIEFVQAIFGRDKYLEKTELLMQKMRTWSMRFDANVEDVLRPSSRA
ncbi:hypothetical protein MMC25_003543 [Agyrium rufum]|nr:hypothetical protein [Agyrium rufum]